MTPCEVWMEAQKWPDQLFIHTEETLRIHTIPDDQPHLLAAHLDEVLVSIARRNAPDYSTVSSELPARRVLGSPRRVGHDAGRQSAPGYTTLRGLHALHLSLLEPVVSSTGLPQPGSPSPFSVVALTRRRRDRERVFFS